MGFSEPSQWIDRVLSWLNVFCRSCLLQSVIEDFGNVGLTHKNACFDCRLTSTKEREIWIP